MEQPTRQSTKSTRDFRARLEAARNDALRESFRAGGAMADLQRAADELQAALIEMERAVWRTGPKV